MNGQPCRRPGCAGVIEDDYCNLCGLAEVKGAAASSRSAGSASVPGSASLPGSTSMPSSARSAPVASSAITGSSPMSRSATGSRRTSRGSSRTTRKQLGAGLITLPDLPSVEPERAIMLDPKVPERKRFCARCDAPLKREAGFCGKCGARYNLAPSLKAGDLVAGQYEVRGPIAFGGLGWIYLAFDRLLSRYVVLKGLLNTQDESAAAAALAERQFLAAVKHPNIVGIYNFVQSGAEGFIVMEYVGGKTLKQIRQERGPLPVAEAIAYIHRILPAFAYLHRQGLVYCDFKPENVMLERDDVKLIDLGGVRRINDTQGDIYGTVGYSAPEAGAGPTPASDLFTIGRSLAVLLTNISGFAKEHQYTLPGPAEEPKFAEHESLYRALMKATAENPDDRFESADAMAEQLLGVLREIVAGETGTPRPGASLDFGADLLGLDAGNEMDPVLPDPRYLPVPSLDLADPAAQAVSSALAVVDRAARITALGLVCKQFPRSREARLRLAAAMSDVSGEPGASGPGAGGIPEASAAAAEQLLQALGSEDPWDWRVLWFQARLRLAQGKPAEARKLFDQVYFDLPGDLAPKLALGLAAELAGDLPIATKMYELVSRPDPGFVSAVFGLARCRFKEGDRKAAVAALSRIPASSALFVRSRFEAARLLVQRDPAIPAPTLEDLASASALAESLPLTGMSKWTLHSLIFSSAVAAAGPRTVASGNGLGNSAGLNNPDLKILGRPLEINSLGQGLETAFRSMARFTPAGERIRLVDQANQVRPRTLI